MVSINTNSAINLASQVINFASKSGKVDAPQVANLAKVLDGLSGLMGNGGAGAAKQQPMSSLFGTGAFDAAEADKKNKAKAVAAGGGEMSLGALLAFVGKTLVGAMNNTMDQLKKAAQDLDSTTTKGGPTASQNQKIQELTFNLQQIQQTLNRVNEAVTNLSKSNTDAQKATIQNLSV